MTGRICISDCIESSSTIPARMFVIEASFIRFPNLIAFFHLPVSFSYRLKGVVCSHEENGGIPFLLNLYRDRGAQFLSRYSTMPCKASAAGTAMVGTTTHGNVVIVEVPKSGLVMRPRLIA